MKFAYMFRYLSRRRDVTACANHHSNNSSTQAAAPDPYGIATLSVAQQQPSVTRTINIRQRIALPPDAVLTVNPVGCFSGRCASPRIVAKSGAYRRQTGAI